YYNVLLNRFDYKVKEPLDDSIPILRPGKIRNSLKFIFDNNLANLESLCKYSLFEMELISNLFEIEQDFFNDYIMKPKLYDFAKRAK
ncbi:hypothetical protein MOF08_03355, partial [Bacillus licheniformis]|nr:hypothetical protein [Bacillus licheniformis]